MAVVARPDLTEKLPDLGAVISGALVGLAWIALPTGWLEDMLDASGVAVLLPLAAPPLDMASRLMLALGSSALIAIVVWAALYILFGTGGILAPEPRQEDGAPVVRRADAHPDAPPRRPLSVAELTQTSVAGAEPDLAGATPAEHCIPADLDTPLSALDPGAIPARPREPVRLVAPLAPGERLKTFALVPPPAARPDAGLANIEELLRRLGGGRAAI